MDRTVFQNLIQELETSKQIDVEFYYKNLENKIISLITMMEGSKIIQNFIDKMEINVINLIFNEVIKFIFLFFTRFIHDYPI